jgi:hypothetical protein
MMIDEVKPLENYKLFLRVEQIDEKLDQVLEQFDLVLKSNARLRADLPEIITEIVRAALNKRAVEGYSRINY